MIFFPVFEILFIASFIASFFFIFTDYFIYLHVGLFCSYLYLRYRLKKGAKESFVSCSLLQVSPAPEIWIEALISAFYYAKLHNKKMSVCLMYEKKEIPNDDYHFVCHTIVSYSTLLFFLNHHSEDFLFYITGQGVILSVCWQAKNNIPEQCQKKEIFIISKSEQTMLFTIKTAQKVFVEVTSSYMSYFIKIFLKNNQYKDKINI